MKSVLASLVLLLSISAEARFCEPYYGESYGAVGICKDTAGIKVNRNLMGVYLEPKSGVMITVNENGISLANYNQWADCAATAVRGYKRAVEDNPKQRPAVPACATPSTDGSTWVSTKLSSDVRFVKTSEVYIYETLTLTREQNGSFSMKRSILGGSALFGIPEGSWSSAIPLKKIK